MLGAEEPRPAAPPPAGRRIRIVTAGQRQRVADDRVEAALEQTGEPDALDAVVQLGAQRVDVERQPALLPELVPDVLVARDRAARLDAEPRRQCLDEPSRRLGLVAEVLRFVGDQRLVVPDRLAVRTPPAAERPARQRLARIPLALPVVEEAARREACLCLLYTSPSPRD